MQIEYLSDGSSDCPLIRLLDFDAAGVRRLKSLFDALAEGQAQEIALTDQADVSGIDGCRLVLKVSPQDRGAVRTGGTVAFEWLLSRQGWETVAALTEPFCREAALGHYQWLDEASGISVLLSPNGDW